MSEDRFYNFKRGDQIRVTVNKAQDRRVILTEEEERERRKGHPVFEDDIDYQGRPRITFHDLATRFGHIDPNARIGWAPVIGYISEANRDPHREFVNGYYELDLETLDLSPGQINLIREGYLSQDALGYSKTTLSERSVPNVWQLYHGGGTPSGSLFLDAHLKNSSLSAPVDHRYELSTASTTKGWVKQNPIAGRLANFESIAEDVLDPVAQIEYEAAKAKMILEQRELWLSIQAPLTRDEGGVLVPRLAPSSYDLRLSSPYYYEPFDTDDKVNYKITRDKHFFSEEADCPRVHSGLRVGQRVRVFMIPQTWRVRAQWKAWYLFSTYWAFTFVPLPQNMIFLNRFPLFPRPFVLGSTDYPPVWYWIERSKAHNSAVARDLAMNFFTPFLSFFFLFTSDGFFEIRQQDTFPGMLVAVLEFDGLIRYVWRRKATERDLNLQISAGPLTTYHVNSWGANIIGTSIF